jgi:dipeptidyl aminopeptidase/acylaminoacyl peptidase
MRTGRSSRRGTVLGALAGVGLVVLVFYGLASFVVYDQVGRAPGECWPADRANTPTSYTVPDRFDRDLPAAWPLPEPEEVRFPSRDAAMAGRSLAGWWIPTEPDDPGTAPAVVLVHGIQSCRREPNVLLPAAMLHQAGFSVLLMDLRDHGDSEGDDGRFAGGSEEYLDVLGGWDWVAGQGVSAERIGLLGLSFGSLNAIIAGGQEPRVRAVWADSAPARTHEAIGLFVASQVGDPTGLSRLLVPGTVLWARLIAGDDITRFDAIEQVEAYDGRSIAFVHGEDDSVLPPAYATELRERAVAAGATSPEAWIVPGAGHTEAVYVQAERYARRLVAFFSAALGEP